MNGRSSLVLLLLLIPASAPGQSAPRDSNQGNPASAAQRERSHVERFSSLDARAERLETEANDKLASNPNDSEALNRRAVARMRLSRYPEAVEDLRRAVS